MPSISLPGAAECIVRPRNNVPMIGPRLLAALRPAALVLAAWALAPSAAAQERAQEMEEDHRDHDAVKGQLKAWMMALQAMMLALQAKILALQARMMVWQAN